MAAKYRIGVLLCAVLLLMSGGGALGAELSLRDQMAIHTTDNAKTGTNWTWFDLRDPARLAAMPAHWHLLVDRSRFAQITIDLRTRDGALHRIGHDQYDLADEVAPGGALRFDIDWPGSAVTGLRIGLQALDHPSLVRRVTAMDDGVYADFKARWQLVLGLFGGLVGSALVYNLFINFGTGQPFTRWYIAWGAASLSYGLVWMGAASALVPWLVGPPAMRLIYVLIGCVVGLACLFLMALIEEGKAAVWRGPVRFLALSAIAMGLLSADEGLCDAIVMDRLFNLVMAGAVAATLASLVCAARRGSRLSWLMLLGWTPVVLVFTARLARNFGLVPQSDLVDHATFVALGLESLLFSLAIADRFRLLRLERDAAADAVRAIRLEAEVLRLAAQSDFLTGLGNRAAFNERSEALMAAGETFTLLLIDVDFLKELNDTQGHKAGDALLQCVGRTLAALTGDQVHTMRIGGDEFAVLVARDCLAEIRVSAALEALQGAAWEQGEWSGRLSLSIGSVTSEAVTSVEALCKYADLALYEAKRKGRGQHCVFDFALKTLIDNRTQLTAAARRGLANGEFAMHYQPIFDLARGGCVGAEALLRWEHPRLGLITPAAFGELFDHAEIGLALQQRVMTLALEELRRAPPGATSLSVNFTAMDLRGADAAHALLDRMASMSIAPPSLCIEVTEGVLLGRGSDETLAALQMLHRAGVRVALDDFGTGYASLVHLKQMPVDVLKIDRSFVAGLDEDDGESLQIVRAVIAMGHGLGKKVVAEGIESEAQLMCLLGLRCDMGQGYLLGRPALLSPWHGGMPVFTPRRAVAGAG